MGDYIRESRLWLGRSRDEVFALVADPDSLARLSPPWLRLRRVGGGARAAGAVLDFEARWLGVPLRWRTLVREYDPPYRFVDVHVRGPWARWEHRYRFLEEAGRTCLEDRVTYRPPLGPLGRAGHALLVGRQLAAIWAYRSARLAELVGPAVSATR